mmetsp:Transcript_35454/g.101932  ORF Transcript_35454/g.101932 Transcript_35454/m.101932 type:complete len:249 (+) Transcript_35454:40-786(+)
MATPEQILEVFRRFDAKGDGFISNEQLSQVLRQLDASRWHDGNIALLLENSGLSQTGGDGKVIRYEDLISWAMGRNPGKAESRLLRTEANEACQAAFDGSLDTLRGLIAAGDREAAGQAGFVKVGDALAGLWTMGFNSFEIRTLAAEPNLPPASPLQYATFSGKADVVRFLLEECGMSKTDEGALGVAAEDIATSHRVGLDGEAVLDEGEVLEMMQDELPLNQDSLERSVTRTLERTNTRRQSADAGN